jgi:hypothetical protein
MSKNVNIILIGGFPPGCGKSSILDFLMNQLNEKSISSALFRSDDITNEEKNNGAPLYFSSAIEKALVKKVDFILIDKNIPVYEHLAGIYRPLNTLGLKYNVNFHVYMILPTSFNINKAIERMMARPKSDLPNVLTGVSATKMKADGVWDSFYKAMYIASEKSIADKSFQKTFGGDRKIVHGLKWKVDDFPRVTESGWCCTYLSKDDPQYDQAVVEKRLIEFIDVIMITVGKFVALDTVDSVDSIKTAKTVNLDEEKQMTDIVDKIEKIII